MRQCEARVKRSQWWTEVFERDLFRDDSGELIHRAISRVGHDREDDGYDGESTGKSRRLLRTGALGPGSGLTGESPEGPGRAPPSVRRPVRTRRFLKIRRPFIGSDQDCLWAVSD